MKKFLLALGFTAVASVASAEYIFGWTLGEDHVAYRSDGFEYVYLTVTPSGDTGKPEDGTAPNAAYNAGTSWSTDWEGKTYPSTSAPGDGEPAFAWIGNDKYLGSDYIFNFIVKGGDYDGYVRPFSGGEMKAFSVSSASGDNPSSVLNIASYGFMIPEPTSGLLLLFGLAALGLKRKAV